MNWETIIQLVGVSGFGVGIWAIIDKWIQNNLDKKKFLYKEKLEAFSVLTKNVIGFGLHCKVSRNVFEVFADSAKARLLINDKQLDKKIKSFFIKLDIFINEKNNDEQYRRMYLQLQEETQDILDALKKDLHNTL